MGEGYVVKLTNSVANSIVDRKIGVNGEHL